MVIVNKKGIKLDIIDQSFQNSEEAFLLKLLNQTLMRLKDRFNYTSADILELYQQEELVVPASIFSEKLSPTEALTKFLKENCGLSFVEISKELGRDERAVWGNYHRAIKKMKEAFAIKPGLVMPFSAFSDHRLTVFENLVYYLRHGREMKGSKIAKILRKEPANVWAVYKRALKKKK